VAVGGHGAQLGLAVLDHGVQVEAAEVVAGLLGRHGEAGAVDQADQVAGVDGDAAGQTLGAHLREVAGRQHRQVELRAARLDSQPRIVAGEAQGDVGALGQLADDLVEGVGRGGDLALALDPGRRLVGDLHVEIGGRERHGLSVGREQHVGQDGDGVAPLDHALHMPERLQQRRPLDRQLHSSVQVPAACERGRPHASPRKGSGH
jgi:hypothetical protein